MNSTPRTPPGAVQRGRPASDTTGQALTPSETASERDIGQPRPQLGDTMQALADKVDVPARVKDKVHAATDTVQAKTLTNQTLEQLPPPVRDRIEQTATTARRRPMPTAVVVVVAVLVLRRLFRRSR